MPIVTIIATQQDAISSLEKKVKEMYGDFYHVRDSGCWFIRTNELTAEVAKKLGMNDEEKITGIVIKNDAWYGYTDSALWEWGKKSE